MGICNLRHIDEEITRRKAAGDRYWARLEGVEGIYCPKPDADTVWNYAYLPVIFDGYRLTRNEVQKKLAEHNIFARKYFYPVTNEAKCYIGEYGSVNVPVAKKAAETVLTLPMYADLTVKDVDRICDIVLENA